MEDQLLTFQKFINNNNIKQIIISKSIKDCKFKEINSVNFNYLDKNINTVFIGIYNTYDVHLFDNHIGKKWVLWCGKDCDYKSSLRRNILLKINLDLVENLTAYNAHNNLDLLKVKHYNLNDNKYYEYNLDYKIKKTNIFDDITKVYILNLKRRKDRKQIMDFKLNDIGFNNYEYFEATDYVNDLEVNELFNNFKNTITPKDFIGNIPFIQNPSNYAILKTYKSVYEKIINSNYLDDEYIIIFEDDICFINNIDKEDIVLDKDIIYLGSNELNNIVLKEINSTNITYGAYGICYKVKVIKKFYDLYLKNFYNLRKPYDYLLWEFINKNNISNKIIYPNLVIPNLNDSDNMKPRNIHNLSKAKNWVLLDYKLIDLELIFYDMYKEVINNNINLRFFKDKNILDISYYQISKIIEENNKSFCFLINSNSINEFESFLKYFNKQKYPFWRAYYFDTKFNNLVKKYKLSKKIMHIDKNKVSNYCNLVNNYQEFFYKDDFIIYLNTTFVLPDNFFENLNESKLTQNIYYYDVLKRKLNKL